MSFNTHVHLQAKTAVIPIARVVNHDDDLLQSTQVAPCNQVVACHT